MFFDVIITANNISVCRKFAKIVCNLEASGKERILSLFVTGFAIDEKVFVVLRLVDAEEVETVGEDLDELGVLVDGELRRDATGIWPVNDDLLGGRHVGGDEQRGVALLLSQHLLQILQEQAVYARHDHAKYGQDVSN